jgi:hypothetical protein
LGTSIILSLGLLVTKRHAESHSQEFQDV